MSNRPALTETIASTATIKLASLSESTFFCTPIEERFERITRIARRALGVPVAAITFLTEEKQWFKSVAGWAVSELPNDHSFCPITLAAGEMTVFEDTRQDPCVSQHPLVVNAPQFRFYAGLPIMDENGEVCGTFCVFDQKPRQLLPPDQRALKDLAALTQREIFGERMRSVHTALASKLGISRREAMMDPLTRLWNRRGASVMLKGALDEARQQQTSIGVAILDLDNFKQINDRFGHQIGDEVLRKTALRLIQNVRSNDCVCRFGGDEFLLIMKDSDADIAAATAERIRQQISDTPVPTRQGDIVISTSVGFIVRSAQDETTVDDLIEKADQALLESKSRGRDQVVQVD